MADAEGRRAYPDTERYPDDEAHRKYRAEWNTRRIGRAAR